MAKQFFFLIGGEMTKGEEYLKLYPKLAKKWIVQCVGCQKKGFRPEMPLSSLNSFSFRTLRQYFEKLELNTVGLCSSCDN